MARTKIVEIQEEVPFTIVETLEPKSGPIAIRPYFDATHKNMGLEKYGLSFFDGIFHEEQIVCIEHNGIKRYKTGLNEFAPEIKLIRDADEREARVKEIRRTVAELERELAANIINEDDPEFWNKVKLLRPDNDSFWSRITIRAGNDPVFLDPVRDPYDRIKMYAIEAGGFSMVAKSYEEARSLPNTPKFYLDKTIETVSTKTELKKLKNRAITELQKLFETNPKKLMYIAKVVDVNSVQYKLNTPVDILYDNLDRFINGEGVEKSVKRASKMFVDAVETTMENLIIKSIIKDSAYYKYITPKSDGFIYEVESGAMLGRNTSEVLEYLKNPLNQDVLDRLKLKVEKYWKS